MKRLIPVFFFVISATLNAQETYSSGNCKAAYKFEVNTQIMTYASATAINFYDASEGDVKEWHWNFGENQTSREQNPMFIFIHPLGGPNVKINPYRKVSLTIITNDSCKSFFSQAINILDGTLYQPQSCLAQFKYYELSRDTTSGTVAFQTTNLSEGTNLSYFWKFSDGTTSSEKEPQIKLNLKQKEYEACLTVTGKDNCTNTFCDAIVINNQNIDPGGNDCSVAFGYTKSDMLMGPIPSLLFKFYYKSDPDAIEWYWDFGDGTSSNEPNPTHVYYKHLNNDSTTTDSNQQLTISLTIKTADGCKTSTKETLEIFSIDPEPHPNSCKATFRYYKMTDLISIPEVVQYKFIDVTEGDVVSRLWTYNNGKTSTEKELIVPFSIFQPEHKVCLDVTFADGCTANFCDAVYINSIDIVPDLKDSMCGYTIKVETGFPIQMSSCAGWASAQVYLGEDQVKATNYRWSNGDTVQEVKGLCPNIPYMVKAQTPDGCVVKTSFVLKADGTAVTAPSVNWWISYNNNDLYVYSDAPQELKVEWRLCNGTIVQSDSIPLNAINCGGNTSNLMLKDALGNIVYSENISMKTSFTSINDLSMKPEIQFWPNPVSDQLNIRYSGITRKNIRVEICNIMGKVVSYKLFTGISEVQEMKINTAHLNQGIYVCRVSSDGEIIAIRKFNRR